MRKKLFAVIMSAMMMITFMPSMAFAAATEPVWGDKCASVTVNGTTYGTDSIKREWDYNTGKITATIDPSKVESSIISDAGNPKRVYYDLDKAVMEPVQNSITYSTFKSYFDETKAKTEMALTLTAPDYCSNYGDLTADQKSKANVDLSTSVATVNVDTPSYDLTKKFENQTFTLKATVVPVFGATEYVYGTIADKTFTVQPVLPSEAKEVKLLIDGKTELDNDGVEPDYTAEGETLYDATEHSVTIQKVAGFSATYEVWNIEKGTWETVDAIKATNVGIVNARVTIKKDSDNTKITRTVKFEVVPAEFDGFTFLASGLTVSSRGDTYYFEVADDYKAADYVEAYPYKSTTTAEAKANKAAVEANKDLLMEYFNDFYEFETEEVTVPIGTSATTVVKATETTIKAKDLSELTNEQKDALVTKYALLLANFDYSISRVNVTSKLLPIIDGDVAYFVLSANTKDNGVDFIGGTTKKVHIKNAKALKKAKSIKIKAETESGVAPTFKKLSGNKKIKVAKSGKITLKKGLKKGTYKVKVKASVAAGKGFKAAKAYRTFKIKVVK